MGEKNVQLGQGAELGNLHRHGAHEIVVLEPPAVANDNVGNSQRSTPPHQLKLRLCNIHKLGSSNPSSCMHVHLHDGQC